MDDFNPYTPPEIGASSQRFASEKDEGRGVWQDGKTLVMVKHARLPSRCVKCNEPTTYRLRRMLYWHHPAIFLIVLAGLCFYVIVALIVRKSAKIEVPLCEEHRAKRVRMIMIAWIIALAGIALCFAPTFGEQYAALVVVGILMILAGLIVGATTSPVTPKKIDDTHVWLNGVSLLYLDELPWLPDPDDGYPKMKRPLDVEL